MFYLLRKVIIILTLAVFAGLGYWLELRWNAYDRTADQVEQLTESAAALVHAREDRKKIVATIEGQVVKVINANTLQVRSDDGLLYNFLLAGTQQPNAFIMVQRIDGVTVRDKCKEHLERIAVNQTIEVEAISLSPARTGVGIMTVNGIVLNHEMVERGWLIADIVNESVFPYGFRIHMENAVEKARIKSNGLWQVSKAMDSSANR